MKKKSAKKNNEEYKYFLFVGDCCHRCGAAEGFVYTAKDRHLPDYNADYQFYTKKELIKFCEEKDIDI